MACKAILLSLLCTGFTRASRWESNPLFSASDDIQVEEVTTEYGPFPVPSKYDDGGMKSFTITNATKPCDECVVLSMQANLLFPDGMVANVNDGMWLHHVVLMNEKRRDTSCPRLPERFFASGNERTLVDLSAGGTKRAGYSIAAGDSFIFLAELMNEIGQSREAVVTINWLYTTAGSADFDLATPVWLDITGVCGINGSEVSVPDSSTFTFDMEPSWKTTIAGDILFIGSHLHDGGVNLEVKKNDKTVCDGVATYGGSPEYLAPMDMAHAQHHDDLPGMMTEHISSITECVDVGETQFDDAWSLEAHYNLSAHPTTMKEDGNPAPVMGITLVYIASRKAGGS